MAAGSYNPFAKRSEFSSRNLLAYKILTILTWLLVVIAGAYYTFNVPQDCRRDRDNRHNGNRHHNDHNYNYHCDTIWGQNERRPTPFSLNVVVTNVYWVVLLVLQAHYLRFLWSADTTFVTSAANVGSHFIVNNLLTFGHIMLWVRGHFWPAELLLIVNLANLTLLYFRHSTTPRFVHIPVVSGPLAWTYVAILWTGAAMVNARSLPARIFANIAIWGILGLGGFYLLAFKDYTMGFALAFLSLSLALGQLFTHVIAFQWIFAFVIMGVLIILSVLISVPGLLGERQGIRHEGHIVSQDRERAPLLDDQ